MGASRVRLPRIPYTHTYHDVKVPSDVDDGGDVRRRCCRQVLVLPLPFQQCSHPTDNHAVLLRGEGGVRGPLVAIGAACLRVRPFGVACQDRAYGYKACGLRVREREDKGGFDVLNVPSTQTAVRTLGQPELRFGAFVGRKDDDLVAGAVLRGGYVAEKGVWCLRELDDAQDVVGIVHI